MKLKTFLYYLLQFTWGLINNLVAIILLIILMTINPKRKRGMFFYAIVIEWNLSRSLGIGTFIFTDGKNKDIIAHEYGHNIQSIILGPLFLLIIGIPSFLWSMLPMFQVIRRIKKYNYYDFYPEKWANILARKYLNKNNQQ